MKTLNDTFQIQLVSDEYKINQKSGINIIIEQKEKTLKPKEFYESDIFISSILSLLISICIILIPKLIYRSREIAERKKIQADIVKLEGKKLKIDQEILQLRRTFQPNVLAALQKTQENILQDKINTLREIIKFKTEFYNVPNAYFEGIGVIEDITKYYQCVYSGFYSDEYINIRNIVLLNGYIFPESIKAKLIDILNDLSNLLDIQNRESSLRNNDMPTDAFKILENLSLKFEIVIEKIRKDLHLDNTFIHDFVEKYKVI